MNIKKLKSLLAIMLSIHLFSPVQANVLSIGDKIFPHAIITQTFPHAMTPVAVTATALYFGYNCLTREEYLVKNKFPHAQTWYDEMAKKYTAANLNKIRFIQKPKLSWITNQLREIQAACSLNTSYNHIYFPEESLKEISYVYKKVIDGYPLDENEQFTLARYEFMLLHEAGHIFHSESRNIIATVMALLATLYLHDNVINQGNTLRPYKYKKENTVLEYQLPKMDDTLKQYFFALGLPTRIPLVLATVEGSAFIAGLLAILRYDESQADAFACKNADTKTLEGALTLFENNEVDKMFELENQTITPFISTESTIEKIIQTIVEPVESTAMFIGKQALLGCKSTSITRWIYDFGQDRLHEGPSIRAQKIKDEIINRKNKE